MPKGTNIMDNYKRYYKITKPQQGEKAMNQTRTPIYKNGKIIVIIQIAINKKGQIIAILQIANYENGQMITIYKNGQIIAILQIAIYKYGQIIAILQIIKIPLYRDFLQFKKTVKLLQFSKLLKFPSIGKYCNL
jgi:hypothetical protein